jgi:hypothetical protein
MTQNEENYVKVKPGHRLPACNWGEYDGSIYPAWIFISIVRQTDGGFLSSLVTE